MRDEHGRWRLALERESPREREEGEDAEGIEVAAPVEGVADHLFGTHVEDGPKHHPGLGEGGRLLQPGDAEVGVQRPRPGRVEKNVLGLDVAMHDVPCVGIPQCVGDVEQERDEFRGGVGTACAHPLGD